MRIVLSLLLVASFAAGGCGGEGGGGGPVRVVATTEQLADYAREVGDGRVEVETLLEAGADPHDFEPRPSDAEAIAKADVVLRSGGDVDDWLANIVETAGGDARVVDVGEEIRADGDDPHWWQDPRNAARAVERLAPVLGAAAAEHRALFARRARAYGEEIDALDRDIAACMRSIPRERRKLVTNHDAFGWFARRYDVEVLGSIIPGRSTSAQPSAGDVRELVAAIRREGVRTIFPDSALDQRLEKAVARDAGARVGEPLYADTLGEAGSYLEALRHDAAAMARGFGGDCAL